jgi:formamidopyrimidine-DNA glycosylase
VPEAVEVELYRRAAERVVGRRIEAVDAPDPWYLKAGLEAAELDARLVGEQVTGVRRRGKLLLVDLGGGPVLGLRFGMTGRLLVDDEAAISRLEYSSARDEPGWDRFGLRFAGGGSLVVRDPRRLGGVELDPDEDRLGPDAFAVTARHLRERVLVGDVALKARLLDQSRLAGVGNLIADETLWRARLDPARPAGSLDDTEVRRLLRALRQVLGDLMDQGGSHTGRLHQARERGGNCPRCGAPLLRREVGGRTTYSCPAEQR